MTDQNSIQGLIGMTGTAGALGGIAFAIPAVIASTTFADAGATTKMLKAAIPKFQTICRAQAIHLPRHPKQSHP